MISADKETERGSSCNKTDSPHDACLRSADCSSLGAHHCGSFLIVLFLSVLTYDHVYQLIFRKSQYQDPHDLMRQMFRALDLQGPAGRIERAGVSAVNGGSAAHSPV
jgi:hypothetical protein